MKRSLVASIVTVLISALAVGLSAAPSSSAPDRGGRLDAYTATVDEAQLTILAEQGFDLTEARSSGSTTEVSLVMDRRQAAQLRAQGIRLSLTKVKGGKTVREFAEAQAVGGYAVWRSYDEPGGIRDQLYNAAKQNPQLVKLERIGTTYQGREILAVKLTQGARGIADGSRPAVLYSSTQHAREWISTEINRRLLFHYIAGWRANDRSVRKLLQSTELWFVLVANPDGYQYTFDAERLWRKNLRDNNGDGITQVGDGVDPNRNYPNHWGYDDEGSSAIMSSETYRGPSAGSEPETRAMTDLMGKVDFELQVNWHSAGQWILYPEGWQIGTPSADDPIYYALAGNLDNSAIPEFHPGVSSDVLYVTNGETTDYAHATHGTLAFTPELSEGCPGCGFVFPDDPALVQAEFERVLPFAASVAASAVDPANPTTVTGISTEPFYLDSDDAYKRGLPEAHFTFTESYGDPQPVDVLARKDLRDVRVHYRINGGPEQEASTTPWSDGERYVPVGAYYQRLRGVVTGTDPGDEVEVWFAAADGTRSDSFTYDAVSETGNRVLIVAAEDYTGASPAQGPGPHYLDYYRDAVAANGEDADVYDVDAAGRVAPDALGVLSHYDAVVWYTGDDIVTRTAGRGAGNADRLALDEMFEMRSFMNAGGRVLYTGDWAGEQFTGNVGTQRYDPQGEIACNPLPAGIDPRRCLALRGSGDGTNDVLQYYFGGYLAVPGDGVADDGSVYGVDGIDSPFTGLSWAMNGGDSADNQGTTSSFIATSGILPVTEFPQFESSAVARWAKPGGPFDPHTGEQYVYSQLADVSYKQLTREIAVPAGGGSLDFWTSYDTEADWDYLFVEARTAAGSDWTTLPDANGHTTTDTGLSCAAGWRDLHPQLDAYQTWDGVGSCTATGTTGSWNAASGNSGGWQNWSVDLSAYAGQTVEVSISYASDWATQNLGVFVDDVTLPDGSSTSFETGLDGWTIGGPPAGSGANANNWIRTDASGFPVGAVIATPQSLLMGFGLEGVSTAQERADVMGRALDHLLP